MSKFEIATSHEAANLGWARFRPKNPLEMGISTRPEVVEATDRGDGAEIHCDHYDGTVDGAAPYALSGMPSVRSDTRGALPSTKAASGDHGDDEGDDQDARDAMQARQKDAWKTMGGRRPAPPGAGAYKLPSVPDREPAPFRQASRSTHAAGQDPIDASSYSARNRGPEERRQSPAFTDPLNDPDTGMGNDARDAMAKRQYDAGRAPLRRDRGPR